MRKLLVPSNKKQTVILCTKTKGLPLTIAAKSSSWLCCNTLESEFRNSRYCLDLSMRVISVNVQALHIETAFADHAVMKESRGPTSTNIADPFPKDFMLPTHTIKIALA